MQLDGMHVGILAAEGVEDLEFWVTVMRLREEGARVTSIGLAPGTVHGKNGLAVGVDVAVGDVDGAPPRRAGGAGRLDAGQAAALPGDPRPGADRPRGGTSHRDHLPRRPDRDLGRHRGRRHAPRARSGSATTS